MSGKEECIDFSSMRLSEILDCGDRLIAVFPRQPCFSRATEERGLQVPLYRCELHILNGCMELANVVLPLDADDWQVTFDGGIRCCFLPIEFDVLGPIRLSIGPKSAPCLVIFGERAVLKIGELVGFEQYELD